jgi:succinoglycan biosynthesis protein ExoM
MKEHTLDRDSGKAAGAHDLPSASNALGAGSLARVAEADRVPEVDAPRPRPLISICICTFQRPRQLENLLKCLDQQVTDGLFDLSIIVVDNDAGQSARQVVEATAGLVHTPISYDVEPRQSIALARNASVAMAAGNLVAFIDDDEVPVRDWLKKSFEVLVGHRADGVLGPVVPIFDEKAPAWAVRSEVFRRPLFETGKVMTSTMVGIGNTLVKRELLLELDGPFRAEFGAGGEDRDLFRRAISNGRAFVWSSEAICYEPVPPERARVVYQLRRALLRGRMAVHGSAGTWRGILKSVFAVLVYAIAVPFCLILGSHVFVTYLVRLFDHLGKLLAACGLDLVGDKYI